MNYSYSMRVKDITEFKNIGKYSSEFYEEFIMKNLKAGYWNKNEKLRYQKD